MNISRENTSELTSTIKVEILKEDYQDKVAKVLKDHQKKAVMPGFRPGKVPLGLVNKLYGKAVLAEEIDHLLSENMANYFKENQLNIIGHPLPNKEKTPSIDFDKDVNFEFYFDIGLIPEFQLDLSSNVEMDFYRIEPSDKMIDDYVDNMRLRFGTHSHPETIGEQDVVQGELIELDESGIDKEGGIRKNGSIAVDLIKDDSIRNMFIGSAKDAILVFNPLEAIKDIDEISKLLGIAKEEAENLSSSFRYELSEISRQEKADLDEMFFKMMFGEECDSEEKFRQKIIETIEKSLEGESEKLFINHAIDKMLQSTAINLPDEFLKKLLQEENESKLSQEDIDKYYESYAKSMKWQLIESRIVNEKNIRVEEEEVRDSVRSYFTSRAFYNPDDSDSNTRIEAIVDSVLKNKEEAGKIYEQVYDKKFRAALRESFKLNEKKVSYDEFVNLASN